MNAVAILFSRRPVAVVSALARPEQSPSDRRSLEVRGRRLALAYGDG